MRNKKSPRVIPKFSKNKIPTSGVILLHKPTGLFYNYVKSIKNPFKVLDTDPDKVKTNLSDRPKVYDYYPDLNRMLYITSHIPLTYTKYYWDPESVLTSKLNECFLSSRNDWKMLSLQKQTVRDWLYKKEDLEKIEENDTPF